MHRFVYYPVNDSNREIDLQGALLVGSDDVPVRAEITRAGNEIRCKSRAQDPVGIALLWPVAGFGTIQLQTTRLPSREQPYHLHLELARHQLMKISVKREEWGLYDYSGMDDIAAQIDKARRAFIAALQQIEDPERAARLADEALATGLHAGEALSAFHAEVFLARRHQSGGFNRPFLGVCTAQQQSTPAMAKLLAETFHFVRVPFVWRDIQPTEPERRYDDVTAAIRQFGTAGLSLRGGPLLNFGVRFVPDWMYIWENDFEAIYEAAREHVERTVQQHSKQVSSWIAVSGLHADNVFGFSFEQVMELTRMAVTVTKQTAPRSQVLIDLCQPWGEYYARNQQTVPPLLYAEMAVQSGINFDGFGLQFLFGLGSEGYHVRDLFQVSRLIDKLANLGKPIHITALGAPSTHDRATPGVGGVWREPWSDAIQAQWLEAMIEIALSKPYVETVCLQPLIDSDENIISAGGLLRADEKPKPAMTALRAMRDRLVAGKAK